MDSIWGLTSCGSAWSIIGSHTRRRGRRNFKPGLRPSNAWFGFAVASSFSLFSIVCDTCFLLADVHQILAQTHNRYGVFAVWIVGVSPWDSLKSERDLRQFAQTRGHVNMRARARTHAHNTDPNPQQNNIQAEQTWGPQILSQLRLSR